MTRHVDELSRRVGARSVCQLVVEKKEVGLGVGDRSVRVYEREVTAELQVASRGRRRLGPNAPDESRSGPLFWALQRLCKSTISFWSFAILPDPSTLNLVFRTIDI